MALTREAGNSSVFRALSVVRSLERSDLQSLHTPQQTLYVSYTLFRIDFQWRDFGNENFSDRYHGPVFRLARVSGTEYQIDQFDHFEHGSDITFARAGVGWVADYRVPIRRFSKSAQFYWGVNVSAGVYLDKARDLELRDLSFLSLKLPLGREGNSG